MGFAAFFLGEYANMILMSTMTTLFFLGGWLPIHSSLSFIHPFIWMCAKVIFLLFVFVWIRAALPRYRYDQLMRLGWKVFLPLSLLIVVATATFVAFKTF
jgi:NADH-quinone oxidoreductase subunit H